MTWPPVICSYCSGLLAVRDEYATDYDDCTCERSRKARRRDEMFLSLMDGMSAHTCSPQDPFGCMRCYPADVPLLEDRP